MLRNIGVALSVAVGLSAPLTAQEWARKMFSTTVHDFGTVARHARAEFEFVVTNPYVEDVHIADAQASCQCVRVSIRNPWVKTYQRGAIVVAYNTDAVAGRKGATITVTFDRPFPASVPLQVSGHIRDDVVIDPGEVNLGTIDRGTPVEKLVSVSYVGADVHWRLLGVRSANPYLSAELYRQPQAWGLTAYTLRVRLKGDAPSGYLRDHLVLSTSDPTAAQIPVLVEGWVRPPIEVSPASLFIGELAPGQKVTRQVVVRGAKPFRVVSLTGAGNLQIISGLDADRPPRPVHVIPVTFIAGDQPGKLAERIRITTDVNETAELEAFGFVRRPSARMP